MTLSHEILRRLEEDEPAANAPRLQKTLGRLAAELAVRTQRQANRYSTAQSSILIRKLRQHPDFSLDGLPGTVCVDVGCGTLNPVGGLFVLVLVGAERGIGLDIDAVASMRPAVRALYDCAAALFAGVLEPGLPTDHRQLRAQLAGFDLAKLAVGDPAGIDENRLEFRRSTAEATGLAAGEAGIITSKSFLEHVEHVDAVLGEFARITRPGGLGMHAIDGFDHRHWGNAEVHPLEFLRDASGAAMVHGCNRIRPLQFAALFERHGFEVRKVISGFQCVEIDAALRTSLAEPFRSLPDDVLRAGAAEYFVRRR